MKIFVLIKRTFDTEEKISISKGRVEEEGAEFIINPYDEYAIEEAIQLKELHSGEVTAITIGSEDAEKELRTALAMGCDKAVLINVENDLEVSDPYTTSTVLSEYLRKHSFDIILGGNVAIDNASGQVGPRLAELLNIPYVTTITRIDINEKAVTLERDVEGDLEVIETSLPLLVTAQQGLNEPRYPSLPRIMKAKKMPLEEMDLDDLELEVDDVQAKSKTVEVFLPPQKGAGKLLKGEVDDQVKELIQLLSNEAKVI